jgi:hypothetical protein
MYIKSEKYESLVCNNIFTLILSCIIFKGLTFKYIMIFVSYLTSFTDITSSFIFGSATPFTSLLWETVV